MDCWTHKRDGFDGEGLPLDDRSIEERERLADEKDDEDYMNEVNK